jgi:hypothetical protein
MTPEDRKPTYPVQFPPNRPEGEDAQPSSFDTTKRGSQQKVSKQKALGEVTTEEGVRRVKLTPSVCG